MNFNEWLETVTQDTQADIAEKAGMSRRTLQYQAANGPKAETVIKIAEAYNVNPHRALSELGFIASQWLDELVGDVETALLAATEDQLADQVVRRLKIAKGHTVLDDPIDEVAAQRARHVDAPVRPRSTPDASANVSPVNENEDVLHGIDPSRYAAHPKTEPLDEDNPTP